MTIKRYLLFARPLAPAPNSQKIFWTPKSQEALESFDIWESSNETKATDTKAFFASLKKQVSGTDNQE